MKLHVFCSLHFNAERVTYSCLSLAQAMDAADLQVRVTAPSRSGNGSTPIVRCAMPSPIGRILMKLRRPAALRMTERVFLRRVRPGDAVHLWGKVSDALILGLKDRNCTVFREKFNSPLAVALPLLDEAWNRRGLRPRHGITRQRAEAEIEQLRNVDFVFVPNRLAVPQYAAHGIPETKLIPTSYGWDPSRVDGSVPVDAEAGRLSVVFCGAGDIRKGVDTLIKAWGASGVSGRLTIVGTVSPDIMRICGPLLDRGDIVVTGWTADPGRFYRAANVFALPSHEEGSPLVTYEAMGCGLPVLVSPMGGGGIVRDGVDGFVVDPFDVGRWADALRRFAADQELRRAMGRNARAQASAFTWAEVGARRRLAVLARTGSRTVMPSPE